MQLWVPVCVPTRNCNDAQHTQRASCRWHNLLRASGELGPQSRGQLQRLATQRVLSRALRCSCGGCRCFLGLSLCCFQRRRLRPVRLARRSLVGSQAGGGQLRYARRVSSSICSAHTGHLIMRNAPRRQLRSQTRGASLAGDGCPQPCSGLQLESQEPGARSLRVVAALRRPRGLQVCSVRVYATRDGLQLSEGPPPRHRQARRGDAATPCHVLTARHTFRCCLQRPLSLCRSVAERHRFC